MTALASVAATTTLADNDGPGWWPLIPLLWFGLFITFFIVAARCGWWGRRRWHAEQWHSDGVRAGKARLAERFAAGEIDEEEYRARLAVLEQTSVSGERR